MLPAAASADVESHGMSAFGDLKYPADFKQFEYVDPAAPKGGVFSQIGASRQLNQNFLTFNSLNGFILKGEGALGIERTFATLMERAWDEPDAMYGFVARSVRVSDNGSTYRFQLRPEAQFHDGTKLTAHDVAFSFITLKEKGHPILAQILRDVAGVEAADDATVVIRFNEKRARDVPLLVAGLPIFSRAYYSTRNFDETTLEAPLGSGAYKVGRFEPGRFIEYDRVKDWWGENLPINRGRHNFDTLALRVLSRPRNRLRRLHGQELSVPRGVHVANLGNALRFSRHQGRARAARGTARSNSVRSAGLVHQHAPRTVQEPAASRSA